MYLSCQTDLQVQKLNCQTVRISWLVSYNDAQRIGLAAALAFNELFARTSAQPA